MKNFIKIIFTLVIILSLIKMCDVNAKAVDELYLELSTTGYTKYCYDVESCNYNSLTTNQPFDLWFVKQDGLTISANSEHFFSTEFTIKSFLPLGDEEFYFQIPVFRVIASNGDKYEVSCKNNEWELLQDFTYSPNYDYVTRKYRYSCEWQTTGAFTGVQLSMRTGSGRFTGVRIDSWTYYDTLGNSAIIENQNQNQQQTNERLDNINDNLNNIDDTLKDDSVNEDDVQDTFELIEEKMAQNGTITNLVILPVTLFGKIANSVNGTCQDFSLGNLFGSEIKLPCINIADYLGEGVWSTIDILFTGFFIFVISKKMLKVFDTFTSLQEGDILD